MTTPLMTLMPPAPALAVPTLEQVKDAFLAICDLMSTAYAQCLWNKAQFEGALGNFANAFYSANSLEAQADVCQTYFITLQQRLIALAGGAL